MSRLKKFWQDRLRPLLILLIGGLLFGALYLLVDYLFEQTNLSEYAALIQDNLNTAVFVMGIFFIAIWGLFVLDQVFHKSNIKSDYGFKSQSPPQPSRMFTSVFVHKDEGHVRNNLKYLLLFAGVAALIVPSGAAFLIATCIIILIGGIGTWVFGGKRNHIGASGLVLGYYTFVVGYGWFAWNVIITAVAILIAVLFFAPVYATLKNQDDGISVAGHLFGFLGGLIAAQVVYQLLSGLA